MSFSSGTVEEIERFVASGKPVLLYFSNRPVVPGTVDIEQFRAVMSFKQSAHERGLCGTFESASDLRSQLASDLSRTVRRIDTGSLRERVGMSGIGAGVNSSHHLPSWEEDRQSEVSHVRRRFRAPVFSAVAEWEDASASTWQRKSWSQSIHHISSTLTDLIGSLAARYDFESDPLIRYLRAESRALGEIVQNPVVQLAGDPYSIEPVPPERLGEAFLFVDDFFTRARALAELDWAAVGTSA